MMVETILESSQDFGMSNGALPQWKRELLQRRAARTRGPAAPASPPPPPPPPPPTDDNDEELRYGPGIVKRLKSRYLSLALRDAPRRRPSVLRRATSLEHLLDERPPPAPRAAARASRPASMAAAPPVLAAAARRDCVKRARSVDALSRLDSRDELAPPSPSPPPPPPAPRPPAARAARPPRRPTPLLRDTERPPPDVVRSTMRKFESAPTRRAAPAARVSAVVRGLEGARRSPTPERPEPEPERRAPSPDPADERDAPPPPTAPPPPSPPAPLIIDVSPPSTPTLSLSPVPHGSPAFTLPASPSPPPAAVTECNHPAPTIPAGKPTPAPRPTSPAAANPTPAPRPTSPAAAKPTPAPRPVSPAPRPPSPAAMVPAAALAVDEPEGAMSGAARAVSRAALDGIARAGSTVRYAFSAPRAGDHLPPLAATNHVLVSRGARRVGVIRPMPASPRARPEEPAPAAGKAGSPPPPPPALVNGHSTPEPRACRIGAAGIERAWSGGARGRARPPPAATSVVFNFSNRKEVPDYIENDGIILRASRRNRIKAGEPGVVVLRPELARADSGSDSEGEARPPSPCRVRFVNDNVLINGRSSMPPRRDRDNKRIANLKLQFDDSLTRTFEYPSETSLCEDSPHAPAPAPAPPAPPAPHDPALTDNTHIVSAALSRYTPSKTAPAAFTLGVTRHAPPAPAPAPPSAGAGEGACGEEGGDARPCGADAARSWSDARALATDLLF